MCAEIKSNYLPTFSMYQKKSEQNSVDVFFFYFLEIPKTKKNNQPNYKLFPPAA